MTQENRMSPTHLHRIGQALAALWCVILVVACGGAGELGSGGTGTGSSAALGTVTGLGSVFVDGARFDDSNAAVQIDNLTDTPDTTEAKIGQRVELAFTFNGVDSVAQTVNVEPELVGAVTAAPTGNGFVVLGQTVVVNTDPAAGPVTQFDGGYTGLGDVLMTDLVEVHGVPRTAGGVTVIQATRVEKRASLGHLRVVGTVSALPKNGTQFNLGGLVVDASSAVLRPAGRTLTNGQSVVVLAAANGLPTGGAAPVLTASRVRIRERANGPELAYVGGVVSNFVAADSFNLGGMVVHYSLATDITPNGATLANGAYVQVRGNFAVDGSLNASHIKVRDGLLDADLRGTAMAYNATNQTFTVRDVPVSAAAALPFDGCFGDLSGVYVEVKGRLGPMGVIAQSVKCTAAPPGAVIEWRGTVTGPVGLRTFTLTPPAQEVRWTALTFFRDVASNALAAGQALRVEGVLNGNGVLIATKIRLDH
jgi:Domain of unknown function (DUF5666)